MNKIVAGKTCGHTNMSAITYMWDSDRGLVSNRGPIPRSRANFTSRADSDRAIPQRGPISRSAENTFLVRQFTWD